MPSRRPAVTFVRPGEALDRLRDRDDQLENVPFLNGRPVEMTIAASTGEASANHLLGRSYMGGLILGIHTNASGSYEGVRVALPDLATELGYDPLEQVVLIRDTTGSPLEVDVLVWVF